MSISRCGAVFVCAVIISASSAWSQEPLSRGDLEFFEAKVRPVLVKRCFSCHSTEAKKTRGGLALDGRSSVLEGGDHGPAAVAGKPEESRLIEAIRYKNPDFSMPPAGKLPDHESAVLIEWVRRGLPYPETSKKLTRNAINIEAGRKFWSFQPLRPRPAPPVAENAWVRTKIDAFVLAELEKQRLTHSPEATKRVLIRRAYFDLIGLPPPFAEVEAFEKDVAPDAYAKLIDRLLASPHHGERWGRYWLDLARYCDIPESWAETKGSPHLYRDWVVKAINDGMPYDQFVVYQLAADLMPEAAPADVAALGFIGLSPSYWKELKLAPDVIKGVVAEEWEERIEAVTRTFLGLTVACARCHDHKFDPITTEDYYALAGVFASTKPADRMPLPPERASVALKARQEVQGLEAQIAKLKASKSATAQEKIDELNAKIEAVRKATPDVDIVPAVGVAEASLYVMADGPHKTKLVYKSGEAHDVPMQIRGNPSSPGKIVPRRFLSVLSPKTPEVFTKGSGRLELARAIVTDGAPLAARVLVNRVWKHHFGRGLVETPSDFGAQGDRPSHPELLEDLAARFVANGWSVKWLHREIMLSATYRQTSHLAKEQQGIDPDNKYLWRMNRRRLDVEAWRDAMLAVSGTLDPRLGGPSLDLGDAKNGRRTLYGTVKRRELHDLLRLHDFPDPTSHASHRVPTVTPLQQLFTLNSPFILGQAAALAQRVQKHPGPQGEKIQFAYRTLFGRAATERQLQLGLDFIGAGSDGTWRQYAQVLLSSNEFLFVD